MADDAPTIPYLLEIIPQKYLDSALRDIQFASMQIDSSRGAGNCLDPY